MFRACYTREAAFFAFSLAGVAELADARDSKSRALHGHVGSTPTSSTNNRIFACSGVQEAFEGKAVPSLANSAKYVLAGVE